MTEDYNKTYLSLKKRLKTLKLLTETDKSLGVRKKKNALKTIDILQKSLEERYSDSKTLVNLESDILSLEK